MTSRTRTVVTFGASALALIAASGARVHAAPAAPAVTESGVIEDIVVTAQRRSESLKNVPISVQALTGEQLSRHAVNDTRDLATFSPTVNFSGGNSANASSFSLRGVSSVALQNGIQPSTAMVVDGVALVKQSEFIANLGDINRIEILNGPQGTLFGKNSTAGVINIVTQAPTDKFEGLMEGFATNDDEVGLRAMINAPISSRVRVRATGFYRHQDGQIKNLTGPDVAGGKSYGINGKIAVDLSDKADFLLSGTYTHSDSTYGQFTGLAPGNFGAAQLALAKVPFARGATTINTDSPVNNPATMRAVTGALNWEITEKLKLVSITNFTRFTENSTIDVDLTPAGAVVGRGDSLPGNTYPFWGLSTGESRFPDAYSYYSEELRLNYQAGPANIVVGGYYQNYHDTYSLNIPFAFDGAVLGGLAAGFTPGVRYYNNALPSAKQTDKTASLFGDATVTLTKRFKAFAGLRYTREQLHVDYHRDNFQSPADLYSLYNPVTGIYSGPKSSVVDTISTRTIYNLSGRAGLQFQPTEDLNFYASYSKGYKGPAADVGQTLKPGADPILKPEIATAYEVGSKLRLLDNRLAFNGALFHEEIEGIQEAVVPPGSNTISITLVNAGTLKTKGFEGDMQFAVTPAFRLSGGVAYVDSTYSGFRFTCNSVQKANGTCPTTGAFAGTQDITGQQAIGSPKWKYSIAADYEQNFANSDLRYYGSLNWTWTSSIQSQLGDDPLNREPSHGLLSASLGLKGAEDRWEVQVFGKNLTDKFYYTQLRAVASIALPDAYITRDFHRYFGVKVTGRF